VHQYDGKVRVVYKHFVVHPETALAAHLAACAADAQGKFKEFKKAYWEKGYGAYAQSRDPSAIAPENLVKIAKDAGLDVKRLETDMKGDACQARIQADMAVMNKFGVNGTPSFFVNGKFTMFSGAAPFKAMIDSELKAVEASGIPADQYYQKAVIDQGSKEFRSRADASKGG